MIEDSRERRKEKVTEFLCDQCDYMSPSKTLMKRHMRSVHRNNEFQCDQCTYKSTTKTMLMTHIKSAHRNTSNVCDNAAQDTTIRTSQEKRCECGTV